MRGVARVPDRDILLIWGTQSLTAYDPSGRLWTNDRVGDELDVERITSEVICLTVPEYTRGAEATLRLTVDPQTGVILKSGR